MIPGLIAKKLGTNQIFHEDGSVEAVTVVQAGPCYITQVKTAAKDGYNSIQLGYGEHKKINKPEKEHLKGVISPLRHLKEVKVKDGSSFMVGQKVDAGIFGVNELVDVVGISKGKGFAGVVKRYHFAGGPKTHGQSDRHRAPGAVGPTHPGRVYKGKRMAGHMGSERVTVRNLKVVVADAQKNIILLKGAIPGSINGIVLIKKHIKNM